MLNLLKRNLYFAPKSVKIKAYQATVRPILEYAAVVWSPDSAQLKQRLEVVQNKAAKFCLGIRFNRGSYKYLSATNMISELGWLSLENRRNKARCKMTHTILNNDSILPSDNFTKTITLTKRKSNRKSREPLVGWQNELEPPKSKTIKYQESFHGAAPLLYNSMVTKVQAAMTSENFAANF